MRLFHGRVDVRFVFFYKEKTAYEMRIGDWSSDVCSSDLWLITRHDLMSEVVRDFETFSARESQIPRVENAPLLIPLNLDPPEHKWYRQAVAPFFGPR